MFPCLFPFIVVFLFIYLVFVVKEEAESEGRKNRFIAALIMRAVE